MRRARIKVDSEQGEAVYHCTSRAVNGERLFDDVAREILRKQMWRAATYCGIQILTYTILSNHFHLLVKVPIKTTPSDDELLRRYSVLCREPELESTRSPSAIRELLKANGPEAAEWRRTQIGRMGDVSNFMKLLKQGFSIWFNKNRGRFGTLWAERFKSVLVEPQGRAIETVALYIDLNCVRAGLVEDPKDYRFCGYAEAVGGSAQARQGISTVIGGGLDWAEAHSHYREALFGSGTVPKAQGASISSEAFAEVLQRNGRLPVPVILRCRMRYFTDGVILGSRTFVRSQLSKLCEHYGLRGEGEPYDLSNISDWGDLSILHKLRGNPF